MSSIGKMFYWLVDLTIWNMTVLFKLLFPWIILFLIIYYFIYNDVSFCRQLKKNLSKVSSECCRELRIMLCLE